MKEHVKILVVDDTAANLLVMRALLETDGTEVLTASSGAEALELLLQHEVAMALLDVQMPGMDGMALASLMRGTERTRLVPIIFVTAIDPDPQRSFDGYVSGAVDFIYKPIEPMVLRSKVAVFLALYRQRRELAARMRDLERMMALNQRVIGSLSHDILTPLTALTLNAELVARRGDSAAVKDAGVRMKAALAMLGLQIDHLVSLASACDSSFEPALVPGNLQPLLEERVAVCLPGVREAGLLRFEVEGPATMAYDTALLRQALDQLLLLVGAHRGEEPVRVLIDGNALHRVLVRVTTPAVLRDSVQSHLFGPEVQQPGRTGTRVGPGLAFAEAIARSHGGSLIGRSRARDGTLFEMMLSRDPAYGVAP